MTLPIPPTPNPGVQNEDPEEFIRRFLNPALKGDAWTAICAAIGAGDEINWNNAEFAFDQLFISSSSEQFLNLRLSDDGINRPEGIGLPDPQFRELGIDLRSNQLTQPAILDVLKVFYGTDAVCAYEETTVGAPFALADGDDLQVLIDGIVAVPITFSAADFTDITNATAIEVAVAITRGLQVLGTTNAFAVAQTNPTTGLQTVRIYSATVGLRSSVQITGGRAENALVFPTQLGVVPTGTTPSTLSWDVYTHTASAPPGLTNPPSNIMRLVLAGGTADLLLVHPGDYVNVFGVNFTDEPLNDPPLVNTGSFPIIDVFVAYPFTNVTGGTTFAVGAQPLPTTTLFVQSIFGFPTSGAVQVYTIGNGFQTVNYTGLQASPPALTGCSGGSSSVVSGSLVQQELPLTTINVISTANFPSSGTIMVTTTSGPQAVTYTGTTPGSFTGVTGGGGALVPNASVVGSTLLQYVDVRNFFATVQTGVTQVTLDDVLFYRPTKATTQALGNRTVVVDQSTPNICDVIIPATSIIVKRGVDTGAYLHEAVQLEASSVDRDPTGSVIVVTDTPHGLSVGSQVIIDSFIPSIVTPAPVPGTFPLTPGAMGVTATDPVSFFSPIAASAPEVSFGYLTAAVLPNFGSVPGQSQYALQVGGHSVQNNSELIAYPPGHPNITYTYTCLSTPVIPFTARLWYYGGTNYFAGNPAFFAIDDGAGNFVTVANPPGAPFGTGTINYQTGAITFTMNVAGGGAFGILYLSDTGTTNACQLFTLDPIPAGTEATGYGWTYQWSGTAVAQPPNLPQPIERHSMAIINYPEGNNLGNAVVAGGLKLVSGVPTFHNQIYIYSPPLNTWTQISPVLPLGGRSSMSVGNFTTSGNVAFIGGTGVNSDGQPAGNAPAINATSLLNADQTSVVGGATLLTGRAEHQGVSFTDLNGNSQVMVIGGRTLAGYTGLAEAIGHWPLIETVSSVGAVDASGNGYNLTNHGSNVNSLGKIYYCRDFSSGGYLTGTGGSGAVTSLLGPWGIEAWVNNVQNGTLGAQQTIISYGGTSNTAGAGNILAELSITYTAASTATLNYRWQNGTTPTTISGSTAPFFYDITYPWHHVGVTKTTNATTPTLYDVQFYFDGQPVGSPITGLTNASGGASSEWMMAANVSSGGGGSSVPVTWGGGNTDSSTNPQTYSDVISIAGSSTYQVSVTVNGLDPTYGLDGTVALEASASMSGPFTTISSSVVLSPHGGHVVHNFPTETTGSYQYIRIQWTTSSSGGPYSGYLGPSTATLTGGTSVTNSFAGQLDDVRVAGALPAPFLSTSSYGTTLKPLDFYNTWLYGRGDLLTAGNGRLLASTETLQDGAGSWVSSGFMTYARTNHTATLLPDGRVLVTGGHAYKNGGTFTPINSKGVAPVTATAEIWDPRTNSWGSAGAMNYPRAQHSAVYLPSTNEVLVFGGYADNIGHVASSTYEYWNVATGLWSLGPTAVPTAVLYESGVGPFGPTPVTPILTNCVPLLMGGPNQGGTVTDVVWNTDGINGSHFTPVGPPSPTPGGYMALTDGTTTVVATGNTFSGTLLGVTFFAEYVYGNGLYITFTSVPPVGTLSLTFSVPATDLMDYVVLPVGAILQGGLGSGFLQTLASTDGVTSTFTYTTPNAPLLAGTVVLGDNVGDPTVSDDGVGGCSGTFFGIAFTGTIDYVTGVIVLTFASPPAGGNFVYVSYAAGNTIEDLLYIQGGDQVSGGGINGVHTVSALNGSNIFYFETPAFPYFTAGTTRTLPEFPAGPTGQATVTPFLAPPAGLIPGPYVYDTSGATPMGITSIQGVTTQPLYAGQQYETLTLAASVTGFPNTPGYLVLNFGSSEAVFAVPYLGLYGEDTLNLDYRFKMTYDVPVGSTVTLLAGKGPWVPPVPEAVGSFYLTDSNSGRIVAEGTVENISAGGLNVDITIVYPGDRGLGGEGLPATGQKFSDKVLVWGSNNLDLDEQDARLGINLQVEGEGV
jgi:hypothetical protein